MDRPTETSYAGLDGAGRYLEMALMLDLRIAREVVRRLDEARRRLAADAGVPPEVAALVSEIEIALADTGPLEIGVSACAFVMALETSRRIRMRLDAADAVTQHRQTVRAVRRLRRVFKLAAASARARDRAPSTRRAAAGFVMLAALAALPALGGGGPVASSAVLRTVLGVGWWIALFAAIKVWQIAKAKKARAVMAVAIPAERLLLRLRPTNIGNVFRRRKLIATDRRLFLAERLRGGRPVQIVRSVEYPQITALSCEQLGENQMRLELRVGSEQFDLTLERTQAKALLAILCRRTGLPALLPASRYADWRDDIDGVARRRRAL
jgi:hypothetical protein